MDDVLALTNLGEEYLFPSQYNRVAEEGARSILATDGPEEQPAGNPEGHRSASAPSSPRGPLGAIIKMLMLKKWLVTGAVIVTLFSLAGLFPWWWPQLLNLAGGHSAQIEGLAGLAQIVLWFGAGLELLRRIGRSTQLEKRVPAEQPIASTPEKSPTSDLANACRTYYNYLIGAYQYLDLRGMGVTDRIPLKLPLLEMYVPLKARLNTPEEDAWVRVAGLTPTQRERDLEKRVSASVVVLDLLREQDGVVLLGNPGTGKTTFLKLLTVALALGKGGEIGLGERLPILLPLAAYADALAHGDIPLDRFIEIYYKEKRGIGVPIGALLTDALEGGKALLLLDGLDEVRETERRHLVVDRVRDFYIQHRQSGSGGNRFVLTSRVVGYREVRLAVDGLVECTLVEFDEGDIKAFVGNWTAILEKAAGGDTDVAQELAEKERRELLAAFRSRPALGRLASNPLLLTILVLTKRQGVTLPDRRVELYKIYVDTLLKHWNLARGLAGRTGRDVDLLETMKILAPLALWMQQESPGVSLVREGDLLRSLEGLCAARGHAAPDSAAQKFLHDVRGDTSILVERGRHQFGFLHLTFQEYLAAVALAQYALDDGASATVEGLAPYIGKPEWHEVALLAIGHLAIQSEKKATGVIEGLVALAPGPTGEVAIWMAQAVADVGEGAISLSCRKKLVNALLATTRSSSCQVETLRRAVAGKLLALLGDPRTEVMDVDGIELCSVPAGRFRMGGKYLSSFEPPIHDCDIPYEYRIGRYPVTVAQFSEYVKESGRQPEDPSSLRGPGNFPIVRVCWSDALSFCRWLEDRWHEKGLLQPDWCVTLPSEAEWEKAARGLSEQEYPWEGNYDPDRANTKETGIGEVSAVGCFADGVSPYGCEDMSGNVWEWTRSVLKSYPYIAKDGRENLQTPLTAMRVVRGGSCSASCKPARCSWRYRLEPVFRNDYVGFRVATVPISVLD